MLSLQPSVLHKHSVNPLRKHALVAPGRLPYFSAVLSAKVLPTIEQGSRI